MDRESGRNLLGCLDTSKIGISAIARLDIFNYTVGLCLLMGESESMLQKEAM